MAVKKVVLFTAVLFGTLGYWLYCPIPDGYSTHSTVFLRLFLGSAKLVDSLSYAAHATGLSSFGVVHRSITAASLRLMGEGRGIDPDVKETDHVFDGVPVRIYEPAGRTSDVLPGFVYYHGGGYTIGDLDLYADTTRRLCKNTNVVVVSVDYRLAPEHVVPAQFEDCLAATKYFLRNAAQFNVDPNRIAIGGDSAGGNLAATVSLKLRDESFEPANKLQILIYPHIQSLDNQLPSMMQNANGPLLTRRLMAIFTSLYLFGQTNERLIKLLLNNDHVASRVKKMGLPFIDVSKLPPKHLVGYVKPSVDSGNETVWNELRDRLLNVYFSPLMAARLDNLPPAYVLSCEHDPLRDEDFLYVRRLQESGVMVTHRHSNFGIHGVFMLAKFLPEANEMMLDLSKFIIDNL